MHKSKTIQKTRKCYGIKKKNEEIIKMSLTTTLALFKASNMDYIQGEVYERIEKPNGEVSEWVLSEDHSI